MDPQFVHLAVETLRLNYEHSDRATRFQIFEKYDLDDSPEKTSYNSLADEFGLTTTTVNNHLAAARRDFRKILIEKLRQLTASDEEFDSLRDNCWESTLNEMAF